MDFRPEETPSILQSVEIDTSCPYVPFGRIEFLVHSLAENGNPDLFWSWCISRDGLIDFGAGRIEAIEHTKLPSIFDTIRSDLDRVNVSLELPNAAQILECFAVYDGCPHCVGCILMLRSASRAYYLHWHRES